ncbi:MAG: rod shape-determining protein RodA [Burkholderiaceae bacterium]
MTSRLTHQTLWQRVGPYFKVFDLQLSLILLCIVALALVTQYSAAYDYPGRWMDQARNFVIAFVVLWVAANVAPQTLLKIAVPMYVIGLMLLLCVATFGDVSKGARRWLHIGVTRIQPSELMKIAMPLMLAWFFQQRETAIRFRDHLIAAGLLIVPALFILRQPDLGTALLVIAAGFYVIFFAGLSWKLLIGLLVSALSSLPLVWVLMHDYQRQRVLMLIDPSKDPLGKGFHIIQSTIAVGSGGLTGKGFLQGTQTHLEFLPERTTDFIFAVYSEEFGLIGNVLLLSLYFLLVCRGLIIAASAPTLFSRLLAGSITLIFFTYAFVNMGMVSGILPVVGVPLPLMSYGGTALVTLGLGAGILMSISRHRKLVQT